MDITFISAGAGSGKTYKLTSLIIEAIRGGTDPARIMATTFTRKAAREIRERVGTAVAETGELRLIQEAPAMTIGTVNSVCGQLLDRFAFDAGLPPHLGVIEEQDSMHLLKQAMDACVDGQTRKRLMDIEDRFGYVRDQKDSWMQHVLGIVGAARSNGIRREDLPAMAERNADAMLRCFGAALVNPDRELLDALAAFLPIMDRRQQEKPLKNSAGFIETCRAMQKDLAAGSVAWRGWVDLAKGAYGQNIATEGSAIKEVAGRIFSHPGLHQDIRDYLVLCFGAAAASLDAFAQAKRLRGVVDFADQESLLYHILDKPELQFRLREQLGLLLVDEFQDTSPIQLALFLKLARLADKCIWVGDVKQSIYGFRGSDARLMDEVVKALPGFGGHREILGRSWRSRPSLVALANAVFIPAFSPALPPEAVALEAERREHERFHPLEHWILDGNKDLQAKALAAGVKELLLSGIAIDVRGSEQARLLEPGDIAVLVRTNDTAAQIRAALADLGIPCGGDDTAVLESPEAALFLASLRRLNDREDTLASAEILALTQGLDPEAWLEERIAWLQKEELDRGLWRCMGEDANPLLAAIEAMRPLTKVLTPLELSRALVLRCGLDRFSLARIPAAGEDPGAAATSRLSRFDTLLGCVDSWQATVGGDGTTLAGLILHLQKLETLGDEDAGSQVRTGVSVLTYHKAKGLEWPVCICCDTTKEIRDNFWGLSVTGFGGMTMDNPLGGRTIRLRAWPFGSLKKVPGIDTDQDPDGADSAALAEDEARRVLYVGLTRARDLLILAHPAKSSSGGSLASLGPVAEAVLAPGEPGLTYLELPSGERIPRYCRYLSAGTGDKDENPGTGPEASIPHAATQGAVMAWPAVCLPGSTRTSRLPAFVVPSEHVATAVAIKGSPVVYGTGLPLTAGQNLRIPGTVYHAFLAWAVANPRILDDAGAVRAFLQRQPENTGLQPQELAASVRSLLGWLGSQWPGAELCTEYSFSCPRDNGQIVTGRIDLVVDTRDGLAIIDHKLVHAFGTLDDLTTSGWVAQLDAYAEGLARATGRSVRGAWVNLPVEGTILRVA
jgi:ATP-dependent exoDNAse (exonuclease V) beta subunit